MPQSLNVKYTELMARADELERPLPPIPSTNPAGPCNLSFVGDAASQLAISADSMRRYLQAVEREWRTLATYLRNAAKAYEEVDTSAAEEIDAVNTDGSGSGAGNGEGMKVMCDPDEEYYPPLPPPPPPPPAFVYPYYEVRQAATDIEAGDDGVGFKTFAHEWDVFQRKLQLEEQRFNRFVDWDGDARQKVESNFDSHVSWIRSMTAECRSLGAQALKVVAAHKKARVYGYHGTRDGTGSATQPEEHPTTYEVSQADYWYKYYSEHHQSYLRYAIDWYDKLQKHSETSLELYIKNAGMPLQPANPIPPISAQGAKIDPPLDPNDPNNKPHDPNNPNDPNNPYDPNNPNNPYDPNNPFDPNNPDSPWNEGGGNDSTTPSVPTIPSVPGGAATDPKLTDAINKLGKGSGIPGGMKPAGVGGGGGGGGVSAPKMPMGAAAGNESVAAAGAAAGKAGLGTAIPGVGGTGGMGAGGGMPMGGAPAGGGKDGKQGKRGATEDEALYTEDRSWTEGVIGRRRAKDQP